MPVSEPLSQGQVDRIVALAREGVPRNQIAREVGVSVGSVSKYSKAAGVSFDRRRTSAATAAAKVDSAAKREALSVGILSRIAVALDQLEAQTPSSLREQEQVARALKDLSQSFSTVTRASPIPDRSTDEARDVLRQFSLDLRMHWGEGDTYGQVEPTPEAADAKA